MSVSRGKWLRGGGRMLVAWLTRVVLPARVQLLPGLL